MVTQTPQVRATGARTGRLPALDGVRGLAALVVVIYHASLIARPYVDGDLSRAVWSTVTESPLKLPFAGTEAVQVFFVLSGLVITLPVLREGFSWSSYYVSRLLRLYLPVWAAIAFSLALIAIVPRHLDKVTPHSWIADTHQLTPDILAGLRDATLVVRGYPTINVLWSLRWEVVFSVLLPVFVVIALAVRRYVWIAAAVCTAAIVAGRVIDADAGALDALIYLPTFMLGCLIAVRADDLRAWAARRDRPVFWAALTAASALVLVSSWIGRPIFPTDTVAYRVLFGLAGVGAAGLIIVALGSPAAQRFLQRRSFAWLGGISFSLYLVHLPILVTLAYAWGDAAWPLVALVGIPLSLVVARLFLQVVEKPSHRLARAAGTRARMLVGT